MRKHNKVLYIITATVFISILFSSCNQSDVGIFYGIEKEEKIKDGSLSNSITIGAMDKLLTELYIAAGKVYKKTSGSSEDWRKCSTPSGYDLCTSLTSFNGSIYAVWFDMDDADTALFKTADGNSWTRVTDSDFTGNFSIVKSVNSTYMVVSSVTGSNTGLCFVSDTGNNDEFNIIQYSGTNLNVVGGHFDIDYDSTNYYWFLTKEKIYLENGSDLTNFTSLDSIEVDKDGSGSNDYDIDKDEYFNYLYAYDDGNHVYANRSFGKFSYYNGTSWNNSVENLNVNVNDMIVFEVNTIPTFFVGTWSLGYYEPESPGLSISSLDSPERDSITCDYATYRASDLQESAVLGFFKDDLTGDGDTSDDELYALTYGKGLWKNVDNSGERNWQRE